MRELRSIVLASASPRRLELLSSLGLDVRVVPSNVDEGDRPGYGPRDLAALHAAAKADAVATRGLEGLIVAADTVVDLDGAALGKPRNAAEAVAMLGALSDRLHIVHTACEALDPERALRVSIVQSTEVRFAALSRETIDRYVATGEPFDKAGGYGIQGRGAALVERIDGDFYTVMGFPLGTFVRRLGELDYRLADAASAARAERIP